MRFGPVSPKASRVSEQDRSDHCRTTELLRQSLSSFRVCRAFVTAAYDQHPRLACFTVKFRLPSPNGASGPPDRTKADVNARLSTEAQEFVMTTNGTEREKYLAAKAHVAAIKGFYIHLFVFVVVMTVLIAADVADNVSWWAQWPLIGWGLGILGHAYLVFSPSKNSHSGWEERKIKETMAKM